MNEKMNEICYKKNPIMEAIVRIDFLNPIGEFVEKIPVSMISVIKKQFPILEPEELISRELRITKGGVKQKELKNTEWNSYDKNKYKRLCITNISMSVTHNKYDKFESFLGDFQSILNALYKYKPDLQIKRFGVRYINNISFDNKVDPFSWDLYLNKNLISIFNIPKDKKLISRAFHNLELNCGDYNLRFQFGMHNPDYPAPVRKKIFILDLDAYYRGIMNKSDIEDFFPTFHKSIQELFETSITDEYRKILNNE